MRNYPMSDEQCARCTNMLSLYNTNPDRLCGICQQELSAHRPSRRMHDWRAAGSKREVDRTKDLASPRNPKPAEEPSTPEVAWAEVSMALLLDAAKELQRREAEARAVLRALRKRA